MAFNDRSSMRSLVRLLIQDTDSTDPGLANGDIDDLMEYAFFMLYESTVPRTVAAKHTLLWSTGDIGNDNYILYSDSSGSKLGSKIVDILAVFLESADTVNYLAPLKKSEPSEIWQKLSESSTAGTPKEYAVIPTVPVAAGTTDERGWTVLLYPPNDTTTRYLGALIKPDASIAVPTSDTHLYPLNTSGVMAVVTVAAYFGLTLLRRDPDYGQSIMSMLPKTVQDQAMVAARTIAPTGRKEVQFVG